MLRMCFMGIGSLALARGRRTWWKSPDVQTAFGAQRVMITVAGKRDFLILLHGWRVGELGVRFEAFPPTFGRGSLSVWLHPMHGTVHLDPGQSIEFEIENAGPRPVMARAGLTGVADAQEGPFPRTAG
jgi:hypothetical protein